MALEKFDFDYNYAWEDGIRFNTLVTKFEDGSEQRRSKGEPRREFKLDFNKALTGTSEAKAIWDFYVARKGRYEPFLFYFEKEDGTVEEVKVRFGEDFLSREAFWNRAYSFELTLIEVVE